MLRTSFTFIVLLLLVGCTSTSISPTEQTIIKESPSKEVSAEEPTTLPPEPSTAPSPTTEPNTGELLWAFRPGSVNEPPLWVSPVSSAIASNGILYVGASNGAGGGMGSLHALDPADGSLLWSYDHNGHTPSTPTVADGVVYFGSEDHNIYAVDVLEGFQLWAYTTEGHVRSKPAVGEGLVFANSQDGNLYALNANDGSLRWRFQYNDPVSDTESQGSVPSSPTVDSGVVVVAGNDHVLRAIDISDGTLSWEFNVGSQVFGSPRAVGGIVYVGSLNRNLYALSSIDGSILWTYRADGAIISTPVVESGKVFVSSNVVSAFDALSGAVLWQYDPDILGSLGSPAIEGSKLYVASSVEGQLYALDMNHGTLLAVYTLGKAIGHKAPAVVDGVMFVVAKDRSLYAVKMID